MKQSRCFASSLTVYLSPVTQSFMDFDLDCLLFSNVSHLFHNCKKAMTFLHQLF